MSKGKAEIHAALTAAVTVALEEIGISEFKRTTLFMSNRNKEAAN